MDTEVPKVLHFAGLADALLRPLNQTEILLGLHPINIELESVCKPYTVALVTRIPTFYHVHQLHQA